MSNSNLKITKRSDDFSKWYNDIVAKADLAEHSSVKGCMIIKPYGYAIWEKMQSSLDRIIKSKGVKNAYFPLFIPQSFLEKEAEHVEGFNPELAIVTHGGGKKLDEPLVVRPTSETIIYDAYSRWIKSYRDLPLLINQWANVVRWEKRPRLFLRTTEFLWQEGHTAHATAEEAEEFTVDMLNMYAQFAQDFMAMPVFKGIKPAFDKFAGAEDTYSIEAMMQDGKALQAGTSHNLGSKFASAFNIQYLDENNKLQLVHQSSWGVSTRLIGGLIMVHSDDQGLRLPPNIAPIQIVIVPIFKSDEEKIEVLKATEDIKEKLGKFKVHVDDDANKSPGWKFNEWEQKGVPIRIEIGPKDLKKEKAVVFRRDEGTKEDVAISDLEKNIPELLSDIQTNLYKQAVKFVEKNTHTTDDWDEFKKIMDENPGFVFAHWCGEQKCEDEVKDATKANIRNIPFEQSEEKGKCLKCETVSDTVALWAKSY